jgi:UDP-4-amino-4-deoxy-L-arabinose-oxoglutarate aminotransferase
MKIRADFLPLSKPSLGTEEIEAVTRCLESGWITTGPVCQAFERSLCELTTASHAVSFTSGTAAMHLLLTALGIGPGDEVITPSLTFASTVNMITLRGARPVFIDVDYSSLNMNPELLTDLITPRTRAIIPVHFAGTPADMGRIGETAARYGITVIEDAAHAVGTYCRGVHAGGSGYPAVFSFHPIKNVTSGEGGMITLNDGELENRLRLLRFHGIERDAWKRYGKGGNPDYDIQEPGYKYNLPDILAAVGLAQMAKRRTLNRRRAELAGQYLAGLRNIPGLELPGSPPYPHVHAWHLFVVKVASLSRERFLERLSEYNIGYGLHFPVTHRLRYVRERFGDFAGQLPETERAADRILSLPLYPGMTDDDVGYVCEAVREILAPG